MMTPIKGEDGKPTGQSSSIFKDTQNSLKDGLNADDFTLNVSIGSQKYKTEANSSTTVAQGSTVKADGNVKITATEKDINIKGSAISGENVDLAAKGDINITSSANTNISNSDSKASSSSLGASFGVKGLNGVNAGYSASNGNVKENGTTHTNSTVIANDKLTVESGKDTSIIGGKVSGDSVEMNVGGNLNIESQQDSQNYDEKYTSGGLNINVNFTKPKKPGIGISGGVSTGTTKSDYNSVTDQSGIYAGEGGFDITVDKNTDLKGAVIDSNATSNKNKLTTGTLTWEDVDNKAEYSSKDVGINVNINNGAKDNEKGITPNIGMPAHGEAESTTKAGVAQGTIEITDKENQKQDIVDLNRDTKNALNKLGEIFDKQEIAERKEIAALFGELAYNEIHRISERAGWADGSPEKVALHAFVGGIMSELTGSGFLAGASGAAVNEFIQKQLSDAFKDNPDMHQWASAIVGAAVSGVVSGNAQSGASSAASGTKHNSELDAEKAAQEGKLSQEVIAAQDIEYFEALEKSKVDQDMQVVQNSDGTMSFKPGNTTDLSSIFNQSSVVINTAIAISDAVLSAGTEIKSPTGKFNVVIAVYDDSQKYSGKDFGIAVVSDVAGYTIGTVAGGIYGGSEGFDKNNPVLVVYGTYTGMHALGGVLGDAASKALKDRFANTDEQKGMK
ncbi:MAG: hemagglutinin repeat-containing protein [Acidaminococcaceae bacterium]|nr:hemagglutinin repeat-containing protein [Acidaminococcaceae bacterium]